MAKARLKVHVNEPLTKDHLDLLNQILKSCADTGTFCEKCIGCGIDVSPEQRTNLEQQRTASRIKAAFFPNAQ